jgi:hypothetical protein
MHRCIKASEGTHKYAQFLCIRKTEKEKHKERNKCPLIKKMFLMSFHDSHKSVANNDTTKI